MTRQVIIGNSAAGLSAITAIREIDDSSQIILISAEDCNAYSPVALTYYLKGSIPREGLSIVDSSFYKVNEVKTLFGSKAISVNDLRQTVNLENGREVKYDNLLIATGAFPISLTSSDNGLKNVFVLRAIADAEKILKCTQNAKEVIVIGAGLIGLQTADALFRKGMKLAIIEWSSQVLPESIDIGCAEIVQKEIERRGISVLLNEKVNEIRKKGKKAVIILDSGKKIAADMVVVGVGLKPNMQLVEHSGINVDRGILVDSTMRTNISNIFAAGDVSQGENLVNGKKEVLPNWCNACRQGRIAGLNMAGKKQIYEGGLRETIATIFGLTIAVTGMSKSVGCKGAEELCFADPDRQYYRKLVFIGDRIVGMVLLNRVADAGLLGSFIRNRKEIASGKDEITRTSWDIRKLLTPVR
ncbi:NAD(P)/FAD-dependent oxidoreductase [Chloroflexota bacterium]